MELLGLRHRSTSARRLLLWHGWAPTTPHPPPAPERHCWAPLRLHPPPTREREGFTYPPYWIGHSLTTHARQPYTMPWLNPIFMTPCSSMPWFNPIFMTPCSHLYGTMLPPLWHHAPAFMAPCSRPPLSAPTPGAAVMGCGCGSDSTTGGVSSSSTGMGVVLPVGC